jgi:hypothetical protein
MIFSGTAGGSKIIGPLLGQPANPTGRPLAGRPRLFLLGLGRGLLLPLRAIQRSVIVFHCLICLMYSSCLRIICS